MIASSEDGIGGDHFYHQLADEKDICKTMSDFLKRGRNETAIDQWQTQILLRVLLHAKVIYISNMPDKTVEEMHMIPAHSIEEAISKDLDNITNVMQYALIVLLNFHYMNEGDFAYGIFRRYKRTRREN